MIRRTSIHTLSIAFAIVVSLAGALPNLAAADTITWTGGAGDGSFHSVGNWDLGRAPTTGDDVVIPSGVGGVAFTGGSTTITSIQSARAFSITGGTLEVAATSSLSSLSMSAGTLRGSGSITVVGLLTWSGGTMEGSGTTLLQGGMTMTVNPHLGAGRTLNNENGGTIVLSSGCHAELYGGAVVNNSAGSTFDIQGNDAYFYNNAGTLGTFNNQGTLLKSSGAGASYPAHPSHNIAFNNSGTVEAAVGWLGIGGVGGSDTGSYQVDAGATLEFVTGVRTLGGALSGAGTFYFSGSTQNVNASIASTGLVTIAGGTVNLDSAGTCQSVSHSGGTLNGTGTLTVSGLYSWSGGTMTGTGTTLLQGGMTMTVNPHLGAGRTLNNENGGTIVLSSGCHAELYGGAVLNNSAGSTFDIQGNDAYFYNNAGTLGTFNNQGTFRKSSGTGAASYTAYPGQNIAFNNSGTVEAAVGWLGLGGVGGSDTGSYQVDAGATLEFVTGVRTLGGALSGAGTLYFSGGTQTVNASIASTGQVAIGGGTVNLNSAGACPSVSQSGGTLNGTGTLTVSGLYAWSGGTMTGTGTTLLQGGMTMGDGSNLAGGRALVNSNGGTIVLSNVCHVQLHAGAILTNEAGSTFDIQGNDAYFYNNSGVLGTFNNQGTFRKSSGTGATSYTAYPGQNIAFNNSGIVEAAVGTLGIGGSGCANSGTLHAAAGATLSLNTTITHTATSVISGSGTISGSVSTPGTVRPGSSPGVLTITGNYTQQSGGTLDIEVGGYTPGTEYDRLVVGGTASLAGTLRSTLINGFTPISTDQFQFLSAGTRTGTFTSVVPCNDTVTYTSNAASLSFDRQPPAVTDQPDPLTVDVGDSAIFSVVATGGGTITYQWRKDGNNLSNGPTGNGSTISGATSATLTISTAQTDDAGDYDCVVSDDCGSGPSDAASLTVESVNCLEWNQLASSGPSARTSAPMAFDSASGLSVLFGGYDNGGYNGQTWGWDGSAWTQLSAGGPSARADAGMAYDTVRGVMVLFGGGGGSGPQLDTWEWNGATWTRRTFSGPGYRYQHAMAYDSARGVTILFGGVGYTSFERDTWEWNGTSWSYRTNTGPDRRRFTAMAYDSARGVTVLFGGEGNTYPYLNGDTWEWDGSTWTQRASSGPSPRQGHTMVYDADRGVTVLFGGYVGSNQVSNETWEWDGTTWTQRTVSAPSGRHYAGMTYDSAREVCVLFGGFDRTNRLSDTWELGGALPVQITDQPDSSTVSYGTTATFSVTATGGGALAYQWRKDGANVADGQTLEGSTISGATTATLSIANAQFGDEGAYDCVVSNACGSVDSDDAALDVNPVSGPRLFLVRTPNDTCIGPGDTITVQVRMADLATQDVDGFQAFLSYDPAKLDYTGGDYTAAPFGEHLVDPIAVNETTGEIDLAAGIDVLHGQSPTHADALLATMTFTVLSGGGSTAVSFRTHDPASLLSFDGDDIGADLHNLPSLDIDVTPPVLVLPDDATIECSDPTDTSFTGAATATDDTDPSPTVTYTDTEVAGACPQERTITRRWRAEDCAGNAVEADQVIEVQDTTPPEVTTASADQTVECDGAGNAAELTAWLNAHGGAAAQDMCGAVTWSHDFTALSDDCGATGSVTVTFTATDECGNGSTTTATFTIEDTTPPTIDVAAANQTVECDGAGNAAELTTWLGTHAGASASDTCGGVAWSHDFTALSDLCGATGAATVTFTATDACGNTSTTSATFTIEDTTPPTIGTVAADQTVECDGSGNAAELNAWLTAHGGAAASDTCGGVTWSHDFTALSNLCGATGAATVTFTATDACGNTCTTSATFTIEDTTPPAIGTVAADQTVECDGAGNAAELAAWLASNGGAGATDACGGVTWSDDFTALSNGCGATGAALVTFTATDECGNSSTTSATFTIEDTTPPVVTPPANLSVDADAGGCTAALAVGQGTADDDCDGDPITVTGTRSDTLPLGDPYPGGATTTITWSATDACGNTGTAQQLVTVSDENVVEVDGVQLDGVNQASLTRCITFELIDCEGSTVTREQEVLFTSGLSGPITLRVPCGAYECISARDRKHTLKRMDTDDFAIDAAVYVASFMDAGGDNDALQGGNLNDSAYIDILDFSIFVARWNTNYGTGNTACSLSGRHADISGNGTVFTEDFTFIQIGFLDAADGSCCLGPGEGGDDDGPILDISIEELIEMGEGELIVADLTEDGRINSDDVTAFMNGERPKKKPKHEGGQSEDPTPPNRVGRIRP